MLKAIKFGSRELAAVSILELACRDDAYADRRATEVWKIIKHGISASNFVCVGSDTEVLGYSIWGRGDVNDLDDFNKGQLKLECFHRANGSHVFLMQFYARDRRVLAKLFGEIRSIHAGRIVAWNRHRGEISTRLM